MNNMTPMENGGGDANVSSTKLMVNYIPELMNRDMMYSLFSAFGKIDSCKLIANRGYGFVEYSNSQDADKARASFNGLMIQGKTLKVSFALLNPENKSAVKTDTESNLYISNLPPDMTVETLNALFQPLGNITNSRVSQGIAFVCYESRAQAEEAIKRLNGYCPENGTGPMNVKFANKPTANKTTPRAHPQARPTMMSNHMALSPAQSLFEGAYNGSSYNSGLSLSARSLVPPPLLPSPGKALPLLNKGQQRYNPMAAPGHQPPLSLLAAPLLPQTTVYVYNVGEDTEELALWQLFGPYGAIDSIKVIKDAETKKNKGFAFVNMREYDEAAAAIQALNGYTLNGQVLSVSFKTQKRK